MYGLAAMGLAPGMTQNRGDGPVPAVAIPATTPDTDLREAPMSTALHVTTAAAAVGCGAMGGVFFAFSAFVMPALRRLPAAQGIAAMQSINITAVRPAFMIGLFGTALLTAGLGVFGLLHHDQRRGLLLLGAGLYLVGAIVLTASYHVPLNDHLATLDPAGSDAARGWSSYLSRWTTANHVRAAASLAAAAAYTAALHR